jgi:small subunit ribosomal protein S1
MIVEGAISNIVDFGAFVDLNGIDGLIHISELSWSHVNHPSEILNIGDVVPVKVLDIDRDRQRISLGLKQTQEDPWQRVVNTYRVGDELEGTVTKVVAFGAFVEILDGVEGLVHISELAHHHVENPREVVDPGQEVKVKILEIDAERRRLSLSVKRVEGQNLPLRTPPAGTPEAHVSEGDLADAPDYGLSDDVFAGQEQGIDQQAAGLAAAAAAFGTPEQRAAFTEPETPGDPTDEAPAAEAAATDAPAEPEAAAAADAPAAEAPADEAPAAAEAPAAEAPAEPEAAAETPAEPEAAAETPAEPEAAEAAAEPAVEEAPAAEAPTDSAEDAAPVDAEGADEVGEAAADVQPDAEPAPDSEQADGEK